MYWCVRGSFVVACLLAALFAVHSVYGQSATATLSGTVTDEKGAVVSDAKITVINTATSLQRQTTTNADGYFTAPLLPPGNYTIAALRDGFSPTQIHDVVLNVNDQVSLNIRLKVGNVGETVTVQAESLIKQDASVGTVVDRHFVENLPLNGRSFQSLITLTPGISLTAAGTGAGAEQGQLSVNGQRGNANYFTIDGVSANAGISAAFGGFQAASGGLPQLTVTGTTTSLISVDAMQEFKIQTSTYAPEFGRTPGAQIQIVTRSGTNQFHGTLFEYFRNDIFDANNWFADQAGLPKPAVRQNDFGGVFGGPIIKDKTFFFFSYEGLRLRQPAVSTIPVPSLAARSLAPAAIKPIFNAYPVPNGGSLGDQISAFTASYSDPSTLDAYSIRIDHTISDRFTLFGRYSNTPSKGTQRRTDTNLADSAVTELDGQTGTVGAMLSLSSRLTNEFRANYTWSKGDSAFVPDAFGGAVVPETSSLFRSGYNPQNSLFSVIILGSGAFYWGNIIDNRQRQLNVVDNVSLIQGSHQFKFGVDYRHLSPLLNPHRYQEVDIFNGVTGALSQSILETIIFSLDPVGISINNFSAFAQDTWRASQRLTLTYGVRWELNPPPTGEDGKTLYTVRGIDNPATMFLAPKGTPLWNTTYKNFAPRFGIAYQLSDRHNFDTIVRGGVGMFYDTGIGTAGSAGQSPPYFREELLFGQTYPLSAAAAAPIPLSLNPPYGDVFGVADPNLKLPYTVEWNVSLEQLLGPAQSVTVAYIGAAGRRLLKTVDINFNGTNPNFGNVYVSTNDGGSDYHSLQIQYQRRLSRGLQALASYTWSHSIDNSSGDGLFFYETDPKLDRGPSDFDFRHQANVAILYNIPTPEVGRVGKALLGNWSTDFVFSARSADPVNIYVLDPNSVFGSFDPRPNVVPGVPFYINDSSVGGGRRINPAAFTAPAAGQQGDLGRNALRGFGFWQLDLAVHRQFKITERVGLQFRAEMFNVLNHPNFASPVNSLDNPLFGQSIQTLGSSLSGAFGVGLNPLYQVGSPRSMQMALKVIF